MAEAPHTAKPDFLIIPYLLFENGNLEAIDRTVYGVVYWFEHMKDGICKASNDTIARIAMIENRSVKNALNRLEEQGFIERKYKDAARRNRISITSKIAYKYSGKAKRGNDGALDEGTTIHSTREPRMTRVLSMNSNTDKESNIAGKAGREIQLFIDEFKHVNPSHNRLFANKTQRAAAERLIGKYGLEKCLGMAKYLGEIAGRPYAPSISTPYELEAKLGKLVEFAKKEKKRGPKLIRI